MKQRKLAILIALLLPLVAACSTTMISVKNIKGSTVRVLDRHDAYASADSSLDKGQKAIARIESNKVRSYMQLEQVEANQLAPVLRPVLKRHDAYIKNATRLAPVERRTFLRSSRLLEGVLKEAGQ